MESVFTRIRHSRAADDVIDQIEQLLLEGVLRDGDRLPGERDLAQSMDISRPILREALKELENRGLLVSRHGGGTYVADMIGQVFSQPVAELIARHERATLDYLDYRRELEGLTAEMAAKRATDTDKAILQRIIADMITAHTSGNFHAELDVDVEFHNVVGECAHNIILLHTMRACYRLLTQGIFCHRSLVFAVPGAREQLLQQHIAIADAIIAGDPSVARSAAQAHLDFIVNAMTEAKRSGEWARIAKLRMESRNNTERKTG